MPKFCDGERECRSHHDLLAPLWISGFSGTSCGMNGPIPMRFGCRNSIRYASDVGQTGDGREIDKERSVSMQRVQNRPFLT